MSSVLILNKNRVVLLIKFQLNDSCGGFNIALHLPYNFNQLKIYVMKTLLISLSLITSIITTQAQTVMYGIEWDDISSIYNFISVDPITGVQTIINTLPDVDDVVMSNVGEINSTSEYYFIKDRNETLYTIDVNIGTVLNQAPGNGSSISDLHYDKISDTYYAIEKDLPPLQLTSFLPNFYFVEVDIISGTLTRLGSTLSISTIKENCSTYDEINKQFIMVDNTNTIYTINATTGTIISSSPLSADINGLRFDNSTMTYFAIEWDSFGDINYLTTVNPTDGTATQVGTVLDLFGDIQWGTSTIDTVNNLYAVIDQNNVLFSIDLNTASVTDTSQINTVMTNLTISAIFYGGKVPLAGENPIKKLQSPISHKRIGTQNEEMLFESSLNKIKAYPNPTTNNLTFELKTVPSTLNIYDFNGKLIKTEVLENKLTTIDVSYFEKNLYYFTIRNSETTETKKIIVQ